MSSDAATIELDGSTLRVAGAVDASTVVTLRNRGEALIQAAGGSLAVDLSGLVTAHSVVLSMLLCWQRLALKNQTVLSFEGVSDRLRSLAALSNLDDQIPGFASHS
ncbi:STAS domain-containing protein [Marinobacter sp.]|uniref:STAS domain-containing protein n=1 Tax=Marinobacter sp. TaxID=50741 RepID=UPI0019EE8F6B|nr:STAS domain-containing protein [Marinobacter sp.]MBE0486279.1 STAS domain-containing protein [Marinobacter sp.]